MFTKILVFATLLVTLIGFMRLVGRLSQIRDKPKHANRRKAGSALRSQDLVACKTCGSYHSAGQDCPNCS